MNLPRWPTILACAALSVLCNTAAAQQQSPHVGYVYPAGGRQGGEFEVTVGGQFLTGAKDSYFSGSGLEASVVKVDRPITGKELADLRERAQELQKDARGPAVRRELMEIREKIAASMKRTANPVIAELVTLKVTIARDAEPGRRELRLKAAGGLSNPLVFCVGQLREFSRRPSQEQQHRCRRSHPSGSDQRTGHTRRWPIDRSGISSWPTVPTWRCGSLPLPGEKGAATGRGRGRQRSNALPGRCRAWMV